MSERQFVVPPDLENYQALQETVALLERVAANDKLPVTDQNRARSNLIFVGRLRDEAALRALGRSKQNS